MKEIHPFAQERYRAPDKCDGQEGRQKLDDSPSAENHREHGQHQSQRKTEPYARLVRPFRENVAELLARTAERHTVRQFPFRT